MSVASPERNPDLLTVPDSLKEQLSGFRSKVWTTKIAEALALAGVALLLAFLTVFVIDRFWDTPSSVRMVIFFTMLAVWLVVPWAVHRWVWKNRTLDQLARLLRVREPNIGDQLLGVIELADSESEQARSRKLCAAAIEQVADSAKKRDLNDAAPETRLKTWGIVLAVAAAITLVIGFVAGAAAKNAFARLAAPWLDTPRYTFTSVEELPGSMVVPHGESVTWKVNLASSSRWQPDTATIELPGLRPIEAKLADGGYQFDLPPRTAPTDAMVRVGDFYQSMELDPKIRPELVGADAMVQLPDYLQISEAVQRDVRSGTLSVVEGSTAKLGATASRELATASINDETVSVTKAKFGSDSFDVNQDGKMSLAWEDRFGLSGREPFELMIKPLVDEAPSVVTQEFPRQAVLLNSEQLNFRALSADDFGVKRLGMSWRGLDDKLARPAEGEKVLAVGGPDKSSVQVPATFSAVSLGIDPQPIEVKLWVEDYLPGRNRVYSTPHIFFVLTPEEHAIWVTDQMSKWHRAALDVRDRELRLHERNKQLRAMTAEQLADDEMRAELRKQAGAEASNGRKLSNLNKTGEDLLKMAARNPEIGVGHLERWAEMQQILKDIAANRMPSVSDLIGQASTDDKIARGPAKPSEPGSPSDPNAQASNSGKPGQPGEPSKGKPSTGSSKQGAPSPDDKVAANQSGPPKDSKDAPKAGQNRNDKFSPGGESDPEGEKKDKPKIPLIVDAESSQQPLDDVAAKKEPPKKDGQGRLTLPSTTIASPGKQKEQEACDVPDGEAMDEAIEEQEDLLAEFEKVADELNTVLANLEGSTLVKRLKAASREQNQVAEKISSRIDAVFGMSRRAKPEDTKMLSGLADVEKKSSQVVSYIMDDMQSYYERRRMIQFKNVLDEMKTAEVLTALTDLGEKIPKKQGMSMAQCEYWSDTFDRWADDLVDPVSGGT